MGLKNVDIQVPGEATDEAMIALARNMVQNPDPSRWNRDHEVVGKLTPHQRDNLAAKADLLAEEARVQGNVELEKDYLRLSRLADRSGYKV